MRFAAYRDALRRPYRALYREPESNREAGARGDDVQNLGRSAVLLPCSGDTGGRSSGSYRQRFLPRCAAATADGVRRRSPEARGHQSGGQRRMMLEIDDLQVAVEGKAILKGISLSVAAGEVHAV